jgi:hypothetical protein
MNDTTEQATMLVPLGLSHRLLAFMFGVPTLVSVAERSFPLLDLLEMNCQPRAQLLLHRWG